MKLKTRVILNLIIIVFLVLFVYKTRKYLSCSDEFSDKSNIFKCSSHKYQSETEVTQGYLKSNHGHLNNRQCKGNALKVFIVPHSHNDPGWLHTFEHYYHHKTKRILRNVVKSLSKDNRLKFIWAEISFLSLFWDEIDDSTRKNLRRLINNGQFELVTGGWVMNDEANTHYFGILQQMIEGHQWIREHVNCTPRNSWAIDAFGHSPTMPYLLKSMGLQNLVIQRIHYAKKNHLAFSQNLEFFWRQEWDTSNTTDLFTHVMPFKGYGIEYTCGPDYIICSQFDFKNLLKPNKYQFINVTNETIEEKAKLLLKQYHKKAKLFGTNVLLVPLGNDFRYVTEEECQIQFGNYQKLIDYMNTDNNMCVEAKFGTLNDYFQALHTSYSPNTFEVMMADFFPYSESRGSYWSGYFTSRPFLKKKGQMLCSFLRATEIIYGLAWSYKTNREGASWFSTINSGIYKQLSKARTSISLFQHHDAVTGTARSHVMRDYYTKLEEAFKNLQHVFQQSAYFLLSKQFGVPFRTTAKAKYFNIDDFQSQCDCVGKKNLLTFEDGANLHRVIIFNSLTWQRHVVVSLCTNTRHVRITTHEFIPVTIQISPIFAPSGGMINSLYCVSFVVDIKPLSLTTYLAHTVAYREKNELSYLSNITVLNFKGYLQVSDGFEHTKTKKFSHKFSISNHILKAEFSNKGFLCGLSFKENDVQIPFHINFVLYKADKDSGAYIFHPEGYAQSLFIDPDTTIRIIEGPLYSQVEVALSLVGHLVRIYKSSGIDSLGLEVRNLIDISGLQNCELAMGITSPIKNDNLFYSDSNGFQMIKRKYTSSIPVEGNYYPMTAAAYIEDNNYRVTVVSAQPGGVTSLVEGQIEIMQDRRLSQDDHKGLGEGVLDNVPTEALYRILLEKRKNECWSTSQHSSSVLSPYGYQSSHTILYPLIKMTALKNRGKNLKWHFSSMKDEVGHDLHLVKLHSLVGATSMEAGLIFHRTPVNPCFPTSNGNFQSSNGVFNLTSIFVEQLFEKIIQSSLSFLHLGEIISKEDLQQIDPMEMKSYLLLP